jgi:hypothetical protein
MLNWSMLGGALHAKLMVFSKRSFIPTALLVFCSPIITLAVKALMGKLIFLKPVVNTDLDSGNTRCVGMERCINRQRAWNWNITTASC